MKKISKQHVKVMHRTLAWFLEIRSNKITQYNGYFNISCRFLSDQIKHRYIYLSLLKWKTIRQEINNNFTCQFLSNDNFRIVERGWTAAVRFLLELTGARQGVASLHIVGNIIMWERKIRFKVILYWICCLILVKKLSYLEKIVFKNP